MLTSFEQVRDWITDNSFKRWIFYRDSSCKEKIIDSKAFAVSDQADKLAMTEKYLRMAGGRATGHGFADNGSDAERATVCEVQLADIQPASGIGMQPNIQPFGLGEIEAMEQKISGRLRKEIMAEIREADYQKRLKDLEEREKALEEEKKSAIGAILHYFAPVGQQMLQNKLLKKVAGVDATEPVHADPIQPIVTDQPEQPEEAEDYPFTDEEDEKITTLVAQWKKADPDYLIYLEKIVQMCVSGDSKYTMAKSFL